jgi:hypothetical protein
MELVSSAGTGVSGNPRSCERTAQDIASGQFSQGVGDFRASLLPVQAAGTILGNTSALFAKYGVKDPAPSDQYDPTTPLDRIVMDERGHAPG